MEYFLGALAGVVYGGLVGTLKFVFLWRSILNPKDESKLVDKMVYGRMAVSYFVNLVTLLVVYFVRNIIPFDFMAFAIATALALSVAGRVLPMQKVYQKIDG